MMRVRLAVVLTALLVGCGDDDLGFGGFGGASSTSANDGTTSGPTNATSTSASSTASSSTAEATSNNVSVSASDASSTSSGPMGCGDGVVGAGETCDDGNAATGDCCDAACQAEPGCETEVNDTDPQADDFVAHAIDDVVQGNVAPIGDVDVYAFTVPAGMDQRVVLETGPGPLGTACATMTTVFGVDTRIALFDAGGTQIDSDDDGSDGFCSLLDVVVGPGDYFVEVGASPTAGAVNSSFDYALDLTMSPFVAPFCGDGNVDPGEACDDGNTLPGDGCSPTCTEECPGVEEIEPNGTSASASGPILDGPLNCGAITPAADIDFFSFTLTEPLTSVEIETFDGTGTGCANIDTVVQLFRPDGVTELAEDDDLGIERCSFISADAARNLPAGTYFVRINEYGDNGTIGAYRVRMTVDSVCGNGITEGVEECDGGPTCDAGCNRVPSCGDGFIDGGETCEDGNAVSGDGCSATCQVEGLVAEVENNDTRAAADANPVQITGNAVISGSITEGSDELDVFRVTLAAPTTLRFETFVGLGDCDDSDMALRLRDAAGAERNVDTENKGIQGCAALVVSLPAGTYYISVEEDGTNASLASYYLQVAVQQQAGTEAEPAGTNGTNDTAGSAEDQLGAQTNVFVLGDHTFGAPDGGPGIGDRDFYAITVPQGASIRAEVIEGDTDPNKTCESGNLDSQLTLFAPDGTTVLSTDDDDGRGFCSLLDGTGANGPPLNSASHGLAAGTYFLEVREADTESATQPDDIFRYRLVVTVRIP